MSAINYSESITICDTNHPDEWEKAVENFLGCNKSEKYLHDENLTEEVKTALSKYVNKSCIENLLVRIRDDKSKGFAVRVKIQGNQEIPVSEFLNANFCKDKGISRLALVTDKGRNGLSCEVNAKGIRCYKVQNGPPVIVTAHWFVGEKKCSVVVQLGVNYFKVIDLNGVTDDELKVNNEVRLGGKTLLEVVKSGFLTLTSDRQLLGSSAITSRKYLQDEKFIEEIKNTLSFYVNKNCIENLLVRIRENESKGLAVRVKIQGSQDIRVSEFLNGSFCKNKRISRLALMTDRGQNGLSCDVNAKGVRCYKVQNGPPVVLTVNWCVGEKRFTVVLELYVDNLKIVNLNEVKDEELNANQEIMVCGKSLAEAVKAALESNPERGLTVKTPDMSKKNLLAETPFEEPEGLLSTCLSKNSIEFVRVNERDDEPRD